MHGKYSENKDKYVNNNNAIMLSIILIHCAFIKQFFNLGTLVCKFYRRKMKSFTNFLDAMPSRKSLNVSCMTQCV